MKTRQSRRQTAKVSHSRWLAYATAGAATALAGSNSAEAAIHYSGLVGEKFAPHSEKRRAFQLDQPGHSIVFSHGQPQSGFAIVSFVGGGALRGAFNSRFYNFVSKLSFGQSIAASNFYSAAGVMANSYGTSYPQWLDPGVGFVGFSFYTPAGYQYGWARVRMGGAGRNNAFKLVDYAYADPGEAIRAGEGITRAGEDDQDMSDEQGADEGSLGGLALGAVGLLAWRKSRSRSAN